MSEEERLWSVTTLLNAGVPKQNQLSGWAARITAERAYDDFSILRAFVEKQQRTEGVDWLKSARWQTTRKATARGSALHKAAEQYALGFTPEVEERIMPFVMQYRRFLTEHAPTFLAAEAPIYNLTERYAGTMDGVIEIEGKTVLLDVKTHEKDDDAASRPPYPDVALQLVAYARAERVGVDPAQRREYNGRRYYIWTPQAAWVPMPELDGAVCLAISPWDYQLVPVAIDDEVWEGFVAARSMARWTLQTSQRVLGPPLEANVPNTAFEGAEPPPPAPEGEEVPEVIPGQLAFEGEEPPAPDTRTEGEKKFEEFMEDANQAHAEVDAQLVLESEYADRIAQFLKEEDGPRSISEIIKGTKSSQGRIRETIPKMAAANLIENAGTEGRPKWQLKGATA